MEKTSVQLEPATIADLDKIAKERGMKRSGVMRKALTDFIKDCKEKGEIQ